MTSPTLSGRQGLGDALVWIWSGEHGAYWRPDAAGYTVRASGAGLYTRAEAERLTSHCGPEKRIEIEPVPEALRSHLALVEALGAAIGYMMNARIDLESGCTKATAIKTISGGIERTRAALALHKGTAS